MLNQLNKANDFDNLRVTDAVQKDLEMAIIHALQEAKIDEADLEKRIKAKEIKRYIYCSMANKLFLEKQFSEQHTDFCKNINNSPHLKQIEYAINLAESYSKKQQQLEKMSNISIIFSIIGLLIPFLSLVLNETIIIPDKVYLYSFIPAGIIAMIGVYVKMATQKNLNNSFKQIVNNILESTKFS